MRSEYDFSDARPTPYPSPRQRGKYAARSQAGTTLIPLDPDVAAVFTSAEQVNTALRTLLAIVPARPRRAVRRRRRGG